MPVTELFELEKTYFFRIKSKKFSEEYIGKVITTSSTHVKIIDRYGDERIFRIDQIIQSNKKRWNLDDQKKQ